MTLTLEMQILAFLHEKDHVQRREVFDGLPSAPTKSILGRHINSLITAGFLEEAKELLCPHCGQPIPGMDPKPPDKSIRLTESGKMMAKAVVQMSETT